MTELLDPERLPDRFASVEALEEFMTRPSQALINDLAVVPGDIAVLGVGGKMGPTLARLAKRAAPAKRIIGVARFSEKGLRESLTAAGVECIVCDLLDRDAVARLPKVDNVIFMAGRKFGTTGAEELTWAMNAHVPALVAEAFSKSRIVAFSTACVYPFVDVRRQGATEDTPAIPPPGDYAYSCLARERMFEYFSKRYGTPGRTIRLSYAIDMRYGVLHDIARKISAGEPIRLAMGHANIIWQGDANAQALRALRHVTTPTTPINVSGPEVVSVAAAAKALAERLGRPLNLEGEEGATAWLVNTNLAQRFFGYPVVPVARMIDWVADWVASDRPSLGKDTHYDVRDGTY